MSLKKLKLKKIWPAIGEWLSVLDIKPAKPEISSLFDKAEELRLAGDFQQAIVYLQKILTNNPENYDALVGVAHLSLAIGDMDQAHRVIRRGIKYQPLNPKFYELEGYMYSLRSMLKKSAIAYEQALKLEPGSQRIQYFLNAVQQNNSPMAPRAYIENLFDDYAENFERSLVQTLEYSAHFELPQFINSVYNTPGNFDLVLDLGCGTGLLGQELQQKFQIQNLIGVDLSVKMLAKAEHKNIYQQLHQIDLLQYLRESNNYYDIIAATDVMIYVGELRQIVTAAYTRLKPGGIFGFSVEALRGTEDLRLMPTGRYKHSLSYLTALGVNLSFSKIYNKAIDLRKESGNIVAGYLVLLQK